MQNPPPPPTQLKEPALDTGASHNSLKHGRQRKKLASALKLRFEAPKTSYDVSKMGGTAFWKIGQTTFNWCVDSSAFRQMFLWTKKYLCP